MDTGIEVHNTKINFSERKVFKSAIPLFSRYFGGFLAYLRGIETGDNNADAAAKAGGF